MTWWQSQFDKLLMGGFVLVLCGVALLTDHKLEAFALQAAGGCMGCLLTLVTARRNTAPDPTSSVTTSTTRSEIKQP